MNGLDHPDDFDQQPDSRMTMCQVAGPLKWDSEISACVGALVGSNDQVIAGYDPLIESTVDLRIDVPFQSPKLLAWWMGHKERRDRYFNDAASARHYLEECAREEGYEIV